MPIAVSCISILLVLAWPSLLGIAHNPGEKAMMKEIFARGPIVCSIAATPDFDVPATYSFTRDNQSTVDFSGQTTRIQMAEELIAGMLNFNLTEATLLEMYANETADGGDANPFSSTALNESTKSIRSKVAVSADYFSANTVASASIKSTLEKWIKTQVSNFDE